MGQLLSDEAAASTLCRKCGLCCNGVLFDWVPVAAEEQARVRGLGLAVDLNEETARFAQPCPKFRDGLCQIYSDRPAACRRFRCELLKNIDGGNVSFAEAEAIVSRAKEMIGEIGPALEQDPKLGSIGNFWTRLFKRWESGSPLQRAEQNNAALVLKLTVLNRFLDRHFRSEGKRRIMEE